MKKPIISALIGVMKKYNDNPALGNRAFAEFHQRLSHKVLLLCKKICWRFNLTANIESSEDLSQETFIKFFLNIRKFDESMYEDESSLLRGVMFWMVKIATQLHSEILRKAIAAQEYSNEVVKNRKQHFAGEDADIVDNEKLIIFLKAIGEKGVKIKRSRYIQLIDSLPERDRDILMIYMRHHPNRPPRQEIRLLAKEYRLKIDSIRSIKKRTFDSLKTKVLDLVQRSMVQNMKPEAYGLKQ